MEDFEDTLFAFLLTCRAIDKGMSDEDIHEFFFRMSDIKRKYITPPPSPGNGKVIIGDQDLDD